MQEELKQWYEEAKSKLRVYNLGDTKSILYRGMKLSLNPDQTYKLEDVRYQDYYSEPKEEDLKILRERGFIEGCIEISRIYNEAKVEETEKIIRRLYAKINKAKREYKKDVRLNEKRIRTANDRIDKLVLELLTYKSRIKIR